MVAATALDDRIAAGVLRTGMNRGADDIDRVEGRLMVYCMGLKKRSNEWRAIRFLTSASRASGLDAVTLTTAM